MPENQVESGGVWWDREEYDELSELGEEGVGNHNVAALQELRDRFADRGADYKAEQIDAAMTQAIDGWVTDVKGNTDVDIVYVQGLYENRGGWREVSTGQFVGKLDYTVYGSSDEQYMQYLVDKMSPWL